MSNDFIIRRLGSDDDLSVEDFLTKEGKNNPSILGYYYPFYRDMLTHINIGEPVYFGIYRGSLLIGYFPGFLKKTNLGNVYCSLPFFGPNAGLIIKEKYENLKEQILKDIIKRIGKDKNLLTISIYTPFLSKDNKIYEKALCESISVKKFTQFLLLKDAKWNKKIQYDIRKCKNSGVTIDKNINKANIESLYKIYLQNCRDYSIPVKPKKAIEYLIKRGIKDDKVSCYFAYSKNHKIIGGLIIVRSPRTASYYLPCSLKSVRNLQVNTFLIDEAVREAKGRGITHWNWESSPSKNSGVFKFKKKWGAEESKYEILIKLFKDKSKVDKIGREKILKNFPFYFVYPFN